MSRNSVSTSGGGVGILTILLVVFITLKLTDNIDWSWVWVLSPWWIPTGIVLGVIACILLFGGVIKLLQLLRYMIFVRSERKQDPHNVRKWP